MGVTLDDKHKLVGRSEKTDNQEISKKINLISKQTLGSMTKDKVIPTPENYKIYFEGQLEKRSPAERKEISQIISNEVVAEDTHIANLEKDIQDAYLHIKRMTELVANSYSRLNSIRKLTAQKRVELKENPTPTTLIAYEENLAMGMSAIESDLKAIKERYSKTASLISDFNKNSIYDKKYGIYNKKYLLKAIDTIIKNSEDFNQANTLLAIKIDPQILTNMKSNSDRELLKLTLSKLIHKRSRRSDIVAHYEDGIFMIILKHTDIKQAQIAISRIADMVESSSFIVNGEDINVSLCFGLSPISKDDIKEQVIVEAIDNIS
jgi:diguanylate cyclase (GGDEF)-like protein